MSSAAPAMTPLVFGAVLAAAAMHASWNALLKIKLDPLLGMGLMATGCSVLACLTLPFVGWPRAEAWPWVGASVVLHFGYYVCLAEAYRRADMSQIYPIARGSAPLLTASVSVLLLGEGLAVPAAIGVVTLGAGVVLMSLKGARGRAGPNRLAVGFALATAATICAYTVVDGMGARAAGNPHPYSAALFALDGLPLLGFVLWRRGRAGAARALGFVLPGLAGAALSLAAYWIVIWAMTVAPIPLVAALRETSVLFGALIGVVVLREPLGPYRLLAGMLILSGLALIRLG